MTAVILQGDARQLPLPDESVDLIVSSPPYYGLRDYRDAGESLAGQIGGESTPQEYVAALLECTREWVRVLKPSGSIFVNLGDKFGDRGHGQNRGHGTGRGAQGTLLPQTRGPMEKSLLGLPWRYALGCIDDLGLILRAEILWSKKNGMPESVTDRVRRSHEQVFHFTREPRYFSAVDEIREPHTMRPQRRPDGHKERQRLGVLPAQTYSTSQRDDLGVDGHPLGKLPGSVWEIATTPLNVPAHLGISHFAAFPLELPRRIILGWSPSGICTECGEGRHPVAERDRRVLTGSFGRYSDAHGADGRTGARKAVTSTITGYACACTPFTDHPERRGSDFHAGTDPQRGMNDGNGGERYRRYVEELANPRGPVREYDFDNWTPAPTRPAVVLDPFAGTGTTMLVASALGRTGIGVDRSADYCRLARWRTSDPGEKARALGVPKPPPVPDGQESLFDLEAS